MYLNVLNNHIDYLADMKLGEITSDDVQQCLNECYDKPNQCHKVHMTLKQIFKAAIINKIITFNPCDGVELPKIQKSKKSRDLYDEETITTLTAHMLRHEFSTNLFYSDVNELETQKLMGHADISTTRKIYTHLRQKNMEADTKLNNYINKKINKEKQPKLLVSCFF